MIRCCLLLSVVAACAAVDNPAAPDALADLDEARFRCAVEPVLARHCSYLACHGIAGAPLRLYTVGKLRAGPGESLDARQAPLTEAERHANFRSALGFTYGEVAPEDNLLVRKVLPAEVGGFAHKGGAIFTGPDDPRARAIRDWLGGATGCPTGGGA